MPNNRTSWSGLVRGSLAGTVVLILSAGAAWGQCGTETSAGGSTSTSGNGTAKSTSEATATATSNGKKDESKSKQESASGPSKADALSVQEAEKELKRIRFRYFGSVRNPEIRQMGIAKMREFTDPRLFPTLLELFGREDQDVRSALLGHFADQNSAQGDAMLGWIAINGSNASFRRDAVDQIRQVMEKNRVEIAKAAAEGKPIARRVVKETELEPDPALPHGVRTAILASLKSKKNTIAGRGAELASELNLPEFIPAMANAQAVDFGGGRAEDGGDRAVAYIMVATQQAFVADLTPVVGDSAVGFDPTLGVVTEGTYLRVIDAVSVTYRTEINLALNHLAEKSWDGRPTLAMGYDKARWADWYKNELVPYRKALAARTPSATQP